jgi:hypothetical protein
MSLTETNNSTHDYGGSTRAFSRKNRVHVMRTFLLETYHGRFLNKGDIVLDVAGGKGDLSWLFKNIDGLDSIVVDPRVMSTHSHILRYDMACHPKVFGRSTLFIITIHHLPILTFLLSMFS